MFYDGNEVQRICKILLTYKNKVETTEDTVSWAKEAAHEREVWQWRNFSMKLYQSGRRQKRLQMTSNN